MSGRERRGHRRGPMTATGYLQAMRSVLVHEPVPAEKVDFYAHHGVEEIFVVDPTERSFHIWRQTGGSYLQTATSDLLQFRAEDLVEAIVTAGVARRADAKSIGMATRSSLA
jgi:hypothetical protein